MHELDITLDRCAWNHSHAARELGLSRVGLANKIKRYAIERASMVARCLGRTKFLRPYCNQP